MHKKTKLCFFLAIFMCLILVVQPTPIQATSYTTTTYDFYEVSSLATEDSVGVGTVQGIWQSCDRDLNDSLDWTSDGTAGETFDCTANTTTVYQGNASAGLIIQQTPPGSPATWVYKDFTVDANFDPNNIWFMGAMYLEDTAGSDYEFAKMTVYVGNATDWHGAVDYYVYIDDSDYNDAGIYDRVRVGNDTDTWIYIARNVTQELTDSGGAELSQLLLDNISQFRLYLYVGIVGGASERRAFFDALHLIGDEDADYPEPTHDAGDPITFYGLEGLNLTSDADDRAHVRCDFDDFSNVDDYSKRIVYTGTPTGTPHLSSSLNIDDAGWAWWNRTVAQLQNNTWNVYSTVEGYSGDNIDGRYADMNAFENEDILILSLSFRTTTEDGNGGNGGNGGGDGTGDGGGGGGGNGGDDDGVSESLKMVIETDKKNYHWGDLIYVDVYLIYAKDVSSEYVKIAFDSYDLGYAEKIGDKHYQTVIDTTLFVQTYGEHVIYVEAATNVHDKVTDSVTVDVVQFLGPTQAIENFLYAGGSLITIIRIVLLGGVAIISLVFGKFINTYLRASVVAIVGAINSFLGWIGYYLQVKFWPSFLTVGDFVSNFIWLTALITFSYLLYSIAKRRRKDTKQEEGGIL